MGVEPEAAGDLSHHRVVVVGAGAASYFYQSSRSAEAFMRRADAAAEDGDAAEESKWLRRYVLLRPDDLDAVYRQAIAVDDAADQATGPGRGRAINTARQQLGSAIFRIAKFDEEREEELRRRLVNRLVESGDARGTEAETQILALDPPADDPEMTRALALALAGQVRFGTYARRDVDTSDRDDAPWERLAAEPVVEVLRVAVERNPE